MSNKKSLGLALVIFGFVLLALTGIRTISTPDIFTHIALGQAHSVKADPLSYTMTGTQWVNMNPLYNGLVYLLWKLGGAGLVTLAHVLVVLAAFFMMFNFGKKWGGPLSQGLALLLCARLMLPVFNPGPSAFFMLFTATFLTLLYRVKNFNLLAALLLILQVLWTNMHPSFVFGPVLILFFAFENWQETQKTSRSMTTPLATKLFGLAAVALLVTLINPNFVNLHRHIFTNWVLMTGKENLEWISLFSSSFPQGVISSLTIFTLILGAGGLITLQKRLPAMLTTLALVGAFLTVRSIGTLHLFAFLAFPFMILSFNAISGYLTRSTTTASKTSATTQYNLLAAMALGLMILSISSLITNRAYIRIGSASHFGLGVEEDAFPVAAAGILSRADFPKKILNIAHDGGYIALQNPSRKIFCDTRASFYGNEFYQTLNRALLGQPGAWNKIRSDWSPHAVVLNGCWPDAGALANRLIASKAWKLVYFDGATIIIVADLPEYATLINDPSIQQYGMKVLEKARRDYLEQSKGFAKAGNSSRLLGAGGIYLALNRPQEAEAVYSIIVKNSPDTAGAWLGLGQSFIMQKQISKGIEYMEKAANITPRNGRVWLSLFQAYRLKGDEAKATLAAEQLNKFYKAEKATVEEQDIAKEQKKPAKKPAQKPESTMELPANLKK
ncbi:MAG: tetratricopeptide repeat protein [Kiritimatiellales bacterium]